ncbi:hypothetical protein MS_01 [Vibrio phage VPMS1]|uniref:hypothetical protein n=1 Tax=Vibrio phage VPMS1 TaxID=1233488 RepID=UPI0003584BB1|nr:hypothetical protein MS_01 [Vibrio phage VPMS1]AFV51080.1 hypothetical protein MS_01 [Vibrio phage VPMS1]
MTTIKKQYQELHTLLTEALADKPKVQLNTLMPQILALMEAKKGGSDKGSTFIKDAEGNVLAVYCYYHKKWELVEHIEYGKKANTATGLNTMCKVGVSCWSKQQRTYNKAKDELLVQMAEGKDIDLAAELDKAEQARKEVLEHTDQEHSFDTYEEVATYLGL